MKDKKNTSLEFEHESGHLRAVLRGEIDHHSAKSIRDSIDEKIFETRPKLLILNFSHVEFMDSSGLGLIMGRYKLMNIYGGKTQIEDPSARVLKIIELAQMNRIIDIVSSNADGKTDNIDTAEDTCYSFSETEE